MKVTFFGDWHKNNNYAFKALRRVAITEGIPDFYLHVGDFGIYPHSRFLAGVNHILKEQETEMWVVPGNHENYDYLATFEKDARGLIALGEKLFALPRGYHWNWAGVDFAALGGAFSIDRRWGIKNKHWWDDELITQEEFEKTLAIPNIDVLITHEGPWLPHRGVNWQLSRWEERMSKKQRDYLAQLIVKKNIKLNVHGHHHLHYTKKLRQCQVIGLSEDGKSINDNRFTLDLIEFKKSLAILEGNKNG